MDFHPGELPKHIPEVIYVKWDSLGEYMDTTCDVNEGDRWLVEARRGCGFAAAYSQFDATGD